MFQSSLYLGEVLLPCSCILTHDWSLSEWGLLLPNKHTNKINPTYTRWPFKLLKILKPSWDLYFLGVICLNSVGFFTWMLCFDIWNYLLYKHFQYKIWHPEIFERRKNDSHSLCGLIHTWEEFLLPLFM